MTKEGEKKWERVGYVQPTPARPGTPDCPVAHPRRTRRTREMEKATWLKFTGLSGEPTALAANGRPCDQRATRGQL
jgi:hypothetical protein